MFTIATSMYNEASNLNRLISEVEALKQLIPVNRVVFVDNGSTDETFKLLTDYQSLSHNVTLIQNPIHSDYTQGFSKIISATQNENVIFFHSDLQFKIHDFIKQKKLDLDLIDFKKHFLIGKRHGRPKIDRFFSKVLQYIASLKLDNTIIDFNGQPKIFYNDVPFAIFSDIRGFGADLTLVYWLIKNKRKSIIVEITEQKRIAGKSSWNTGVSSRIKLSMSYLRNIKKL